MDMKMVEDIRQNLANKTSDELLQIWKENDRERWSESAFEAAKRILTERGIELPPQNPPPVKVESSKACWEVKQFDGSVKSYAEDDEIVEAIMTKEITPDQECRHFVVPDKSRKRQETKWKKVSDSLAKSSFAVRLLFQPVWAHTIRGASVGAAIGIIFWFSCGVFFYVFLCVNYATGLVLAFFLGVSCYYIMPKSVCEKCRYPGLRRCSIRLIMAR